MRTLTRTSCNCLLLVLVVVGIAASDLAPMLRAQGTMCAHGVTITGRVLTHNGTPVEGADVRVQEDNIDAGPEQKSNAMGRFSFSSQAGVRYRLSAAKTGYPQTITAWREAKGCVENVDLAFDSNSSDTTAEGLSAGMRFADQPNFTIAGVTDWTAVGGHGSDSALRTSESLVNEAVGLKPDLSTKPVGTHSSDDKIVSQNESDLRAALLRDPDGFSANHALGEYYLENGKALRGLVFLVKAHNLEPSDDDNNYALASAYSDSEDSTRASLDIHKLLQGAYNARLYREAALVDERAGNSLAAVNEFEECAKLDPSESSYFEWGYELLRHRAIWQALDVFRAGMQVDPRSLRLQTATATALFSGARYKEASVLLCHVADVDPKNRESYVFMGRIQIAAPTPLDCIESRLAKFAASNPSDAEVDYFYAMTIVKRQQLSSNTNDLQLAKKLLLKAVDSKPPYPEAYLELGVLAANEGDYRGAIGFYKTSLRLDPKLADAYYHLGLAYDRTADVDKAKEAFKLHDEIQKEQQDATEKERLQIKQFLFAQQGATNAAPLQ